MRIKNDNDLGLVAELTFNACKRMTLSSRQNSGGADTHPSKHNLSPRVSNRFSQERQHCRFCELQGLSYSPYSNKWR